MSATLGVQLRHEAGEIPQPSRACRIEQRLVLGQRVSETVACVITVAPEQLSPRFAQREDIVDPRLLAERRVSHWAA